MRTNISYQNIQNAANTFCAYQYRCPCNGQVENTELAKQCYEYHLHNPKSDA